MELARFEDGNCVCEHGYNGQVFSEKEDMREGTCTLSKKCPGDINLTTGITEV